MQWSGVTGGAAAFEAPVQRQPRQPQQPRQPMPTGLWGTNQPVLENPASLKLRRGEQHSQAPLPMPDNAGVIRPLWEMQVQSRGRRSEQESLQDLRYSPVMNAKSLPLSESRQGYEVVQRPRMQTQSLESTVQQQQTPQFMGYGARFAMPMEATRMETSDELPPTKSHWERMMSWMPIRISNTPTKSVLGTEGFQAVTKEQAATTLLNNFYKLYNFATKYYLDAVYPIPTSASFSGSPYTYSRNGITYTLTASGGTPTNLFDSSYTTLWTVANPRSWDISGATASRWVQLTTTKGSTLSGIRLSQSGNSDASFNGFRIYGSNEIDRSSNSAWTLLYTSTATEMNKVIRSSAYVATTLSISIDDTTVYTTYRIVFTGATSSATNISMHTLQLYGGDIKTELYNLIDPWQNYISVDAAGSYSLTGFDSTIADNVLKKYQYYKWEITGVRNKSFYEGSILINSGTQANRFRFIMNDGSDYVWKTNKVTTSDLDSTTSINYAGYSGCKGWNCDTQTNTSVGTNDKATDKTRFKKALTFGQALASGGDYAANPGGCIANAAGVAMTANCGANGNRDDGFTEFPYALLINPIYTDTTYTTIDQELPPDEGVNASNQRTTINRIIKKWYDYNYSENSDPKRTSQIIFILNESQLFNGYRYATGNDKNGQDPVKWTLYGSDSAPYNNNSDLLTNPVKQPDNSINWIPLSKYTNAPVIDSRGAWAGPFILYQTYDGFRNAFGSAYKELIKVIINKYKYVTEEVDLQTDETVIDSLNTACQTDKSKTSPQIKDIYNAYSTDISVANNFSVTTVNSINSSLFDITDLSDLNTLIAKYITSPGTSATGAWPTLYQKIKCIAITPLQEYIDYVDSLPLGATLPSGFKSSSYANTEKSNIESTSNIISVMSIINTYKTYSELIKKARIYFLIKQYQTLVDTSAHLFVNNIKEETDATRLSRYDLSGNFAALYDVSTITNLKNAYTRGNHFITGGDLPNLPTTDDDKTKLSNTYKRALAKLYQIIFDRYTAVYDKFKDVGINLDASTPGLDSLRTTANNNSAAITALEKKEDVSDYYTTAMNFVITTATGYFHRLRLCIVDFLGKYVTAYSSIRSWAVGNTATDFTITGISGTAIKSGTPLTNITVKGLGITSAPAALTYSVTTSTTSPKFTELESSWSNFSSSMLTLIGSSETADNTVRKAIADKIASVVDLYNTEPSVGKPNKDYVATNSSYNWIPEAPSGKGNKVRQGGCAFGDFEYTKLGGESDGGLFCSPDEPKIYNATKDDFTTASSTTGICARDSTKLDGKTLCTPITDDSVKAAKSTDLRELMLLWNKYNIYTDLSGAINSGRQQEYSGILDNYKALRTAYIQFQGTYGSTVSPALEALNTTTYPEPPQLTVGSGGNYTNLYSTYGTETSDTGKFKDLLTFVRGQFKDTYIPKFSTLVSTARSSLTLKELAPSSISKSFNSDFYNDTIKSTDLSAIPTKSSGELVTLMKNYALYTNQYKVRNSQYNTLVVIDHFENLVVNNKNFVDLFPSDIVLGTCTPATATDDTIAFTTAAGATITQGLVSSVATNTIGKTIKRLICDMVADIDLVGSFVEADAPSASTLGPSPATNTTLEANLATIRNKYIAAFNWLFGQLKTNFQTVFTKHETLYDQYTQFQKFNGFSTLAVIPGTITRIPTVLSTTPAKTYKTQLSETTFDVASPTQLNCIQNIDSIRNAYVGNTGVYSLLTTHVLQEAFTKAGNFRSTLESRIASSLAAIKPALPAAMSTC